MLGVGFQGEGLISVSALLSPFQFCCVHTCTHVNFMIIYMLPNITHVVDAILQLIFSNYMRTPWVLEVTFCF